MKSSGLRPRVADDRQGDESALLDGVADVSGAARLHLLRPGLNNLDRLRQASNLEREV